MSTAEAVLRSIRLQGQVCAGMGSTMYGDVLQQVAADVEADGVFAAILSGHENDSGRLALPLRLLGGLHRLALDGRAPALRRWYPSVGGHWDAEAGWPDIVLAASEHADFLRAALDQPPQTNEVGRSAALIGGLLALTDRFDSPVRLFEIGCSAGLNLRADHYRYRYPGGEWGPADSPVMIDDAWRGRLPPAGGRADRRTSRLRHRAAGRDRLRWRADTAELRLAGPAGPAGPIARRDQRCAAGTGAVTPPRCHRCRCGPGGFLRHAHRAVALDHVAVPLDDRSGRRIGRNRGTGGEGPARGAIRPSDAGAGSADTRLPGRVPGPCALLARWG